MVYRHFVNAPGAHPWVHLVLTVLVLAAIVAGVVLIVRSWRQHPLPPRAAWGQPSPAVHELDMRYARGELDRDDYLQRRADILGHGAVPPAPSGPATPPS